MQNPSPIRENKAHTESHATYSVVVGLTDVVEEGPLDAVSPQEEDVLFSLNCGLLDLPNADQSSPTNYKVFVRINIFHRFVHGYCRCGGNINHG